MNPNSADDRTMQMQEPPWVKRLRKVHWVESVTSHIPPELFGRYLLVGTFNTAFGYSCFAVLTAILAHVIPYSYLPASMISSPINITVAFLGYKRFVFQTRGNYLKEWVRYLAVCTSGILVGIAILPIVVELLHHALGLRDSAPYAGGALMLIFGTVYNFFGHKTFSFRVTRS